MFDIIVDIRILINLYELMYSLRVTPDMAVKPFKLYKHTGCLIEDIFKVSV
jgi:hypothetical protein